MASLNNENQNPMTTLLTYQVKLFLPFGSDNQSFDEPGAEWLRNAFGQLKERYRQPLEKKKVDISLFHNHNEQTDKTIVRYSKIQYFRRNGEFFVTGINEGALALKAMIDLIKGPAPVFDKMALGFNLFKAQEIEIKNSRSKFRYRIVNWIPCLYDEYQILETGLLTKTIKILEKKLANHLVLDLGKYLELPLEKTKVEICSIDDQMKKPVKLSYHRRFKAMSITFSANANLPDFICLGYEKAIGFGLIEKIG